MFKLLIGYPSKEEEKQIMQRNTKGLVLSINKILSPEYILELQKFVTSIYCDEKIEDYVANIVDSTRHPEKYKLEFDGHIDYGASPRASIWLILGAKAHALMHARGYVMPEDVKAIAYDVLRHRILLSYEAEAEELTSDDIIKKILDKIKVP